MKDLTKIRMDESLSPETRVYLIARELHEEYKINSDLWYSILELKNKHLAEMQLETDIPYFDSL